MIDPRDQDGRARLTAVLGVERWVDQVVDGGPYASVQDLVAAGERAVASSTDAELDRALEPRGQDDDGTGLRRADEGVDAALARGEEVYRQRFGRAFVTRRAGRPAQEVADELDRRLKNDPDAESAEARDRLRRVIGARIAAAFEGDG